MTCYRIYIEDTRTGVGRDHPSMITRQLTMMGALEYAQAAIEGQPNLRVVKIEERGS
jgi:hypothetical protein